MTLFAVLVVAVAASCINVGKALQKEGTKRLPRFALDRKVVATYFKDTTWATGMGMDVCGGLLMVVALSMAPVSLVQPVAAGGVAVLAVFSHFRLNEKLERKAWAGVAATVAGTIGIGWTAEEQPGGESVSLARIALGAFLIAGTLAYQNAHPTGQREGKKRAGSASARLLGLGGKTKKIVGVGGGTPHHLREQFLKGQVPHDSIYLTHGTLAHGSGKETRAEEIEAGFRSGTFFSLSASACKVGFLLAKRGFHPFLCCLAGLGASVALTGFGLVCQTKGLKDGNSVIVCTCGNVAQMVVAVVFGVVVLGERLPGSASSSSGVPFFFPFGKLGAWFASWSLILSGVVWISGVDFVSATRPTRARAAVARGRRKSHHAGGAGGAQRAHRGHGRAEQTNRVAVAGAGAQDAAGEGQASGVRRDARFVT
jgi:drug/metabolite transporter (DMT)-like permease